MSHFYNNKGYYPLSVKIVDKQTNVIYGFILVGNNQILENQELKANLDLYPNDFEQYLKSMNGCSVVGYWRDDRVVNQFSFEKMIYQICFSLRHWYHNNDSNELVYDYIWFESPLKNILYYCSKFELESLEHNKKLLYKIYKK